MVNDTVFLLADCLIDFTYLRSKSKVVEIELSFKVPGP